MHVILFQFNSQGRVFCYSITFVQCPTSIVYSFGRWKNSQCNQYQWLGSLIVFYYSVPLKNFVPQLFVYDRVLLVFHSVPIKLIYSHTSIKGIRIFCLIFNCSHKIGRHVIQTRKNMNNTSERPAWCTAPSIYVMTLANRYIHCIHSDDNENDNSYK